MTDSDVSPSRWYYGFSILALVIGFSIFGLWLFSSISGITGGLIQVLAPGTSDLDLQDTGEYTIFYENQSYANGRLYSTNGNIIDLQIEIIEKSSGIRFATYPPPGSLTYSFGGRSGISILAFQINHRGSYQLNAFYPPNYQGSQVVLAVGRGLMDRIVSTVIVSLAVIFGSTSLSVTIAIIIYRKRQNALSRQREEERLLRGEKSFDR